MQWPLISLGSPATGWLGCSLPSPDVWQRASRVWSAALSFCHPNHAHFGSSGRSMGIAGAICLEPFLCPGLLHIPTGVWGGKAPGLQGSNLFLSCVPVSHLSKAGAWRCLQNQTPVVLTWGSWDVGCGLLLSQADSKHHPALAKLAGNGV